MKSTLAGNAVSFQQWPRRMRRVIALSALMGSGALFAQTYGISTLAGDGAIGSTDTSGGTPRFANPEGVTVDSSGNVYVADSGNNKVRKITSGGVVTSLASGFNGLGGVAVDSAGNVFVADTYNHVVKMVDSGGTVTVIAGLSGTSGASVSTVTPLTSARFNGPTGIAVSGSGSTAILYVADTGNQVIRKIDISANTATTIAGTQGSAGTGAAQFNAPYAVALSGTLLYVADYNNHAVRKIDLANSNTMTTFVGTLGTSGSTDSPALFSHPAGIAVDGSGNLFVADFSNNTIRKVTSGGTVSTVAGLAGSSGSTDASGTSARFNGPFGVAVDSSGNFYIGDSNNQKIRKGAPTTAPSISGQPSDATFTIGVSSSVTFTVTASGSPGVNYQWQRAPASTPTAFSDLSNGTGNGLTVSGVTTSTLTISSPSVSNSGDKFRVVISNGVLPNATSSAATLTVNQQPSITSANNTTFVVGTQSSFTVTATGSPTPTFSATGLPGWVDSSGTFPTTGIISGTPPNTTGSPFTISITATNGIGSPATQSFTLTVSATTPPTITSQPTTYSVSAGQTTASFSVSATANPAITSYQWQRQAGGSGIFSNVSDGTPAGVTYSGGTSANLSISGINTGMNGDVFRVLVSNGSTTTSSSATLNVAPVFVSASNASFSVGQASSFQFVANGTPSPVISLSGTLPNGITFTPGSGTASISGSTTDTGSFPVSVIAINSGGTTTQNFTLTISQPQVPTITSASSATFTVNQAGSFTFTASGSPTPVFSLSSFPPAGLNFSSPILSGTPTTADNSPFTFTVTATNSSGTAQQTFTLIILGAPPTITSNPTDVTLNSGGAATFNASATGSPTPNLHWQRQPGGTAGFVDITDSSTYSGTQTGTLTVNNVQAFMSGDLFRLAATNNGGTSYSSNAQLTVNIGTAITTFVGLAPFVGAVDANGTNARFNAPSNMAIDTGGNILVADTANHVIRRVTPNGDVTTVAGLAGIAGSADGAATSARFNSPQGVAVDFIGNIYVADTFNHTIRVITTTGTVTTLAGSPGVSGAIDDVGNAARFFLPAGIVVDSTGTVYVADTNNHAIRRVLNNGAVSTFAGAMGSSGSNDNGVGTSARFNGPTGLARDISGNLYVADTSNSIVRKISPAGSVVTIAGLAGNSGIADGNGSNARFNRPQGVAVDSLANVYVADTGSSTLRKITTAGDVTTIAGSPGLTGSADGVGGGVRFNQPFGVAVNGNGTIYVADTRNHTIRRTGTASAPQFTVQPASKSGGIGQSVSFTATATGAPTPGYQWQIQPANSFGFTNLTNNGIYSGVNTNTLTITGITTIMSGDQFRVIANNGISPAATSSSATLTAGVAPVFTSGGTATFQALRQGTFTVTVTSDPAATFSLSGQPSWLSIDPSTGVISGTPPDTTGSPISFTVNASNGVTAQQAFILTISAAPPSITTQPVGAVVNQGDSPTLTVTAGGTPPLTYQWRRNGASIAGATNASLTVSNIQAGGAGNYSVVVSNTAGSVTSNNANVVVNTVPVITSQPRSQVALVGSNVTFEVIASGGASFTYSWRKNGTAIPGANGSSLTLTNIGANDAGNYDVVVANNVGTVVSSLAQLTLASAATAPVITAQPAARTALVGTSVTFSVAATGAPAPGFQWRKNGQNIAGANSPTFTITSVQASDAANYDVVVSNSAGNVPSGLAGLRVITRSYAGYYFGTLGSGPGNFAIFVREDNTGVFLSYVPGANAPIMNLKLTVNDNGQFSFDQGAITTSSTNPDEPVRAAALNNVSVNGTIGTDGAISGSVTGGTNGTLAGTRAADTGATGAAAGFYQAGASSSGGIAYTIVGPNGQAFVVEQSGSTTDGGLGTVNGSGQVSVTTTRSVISETVNAPAGTISGTSTGGVTLAVSGASDTVLARQRLLNISSRARVATGDSVAIAGFVISGEESKPVLIRAVGPTLGAAPFNVSGALASPKLELYRGSTSIAVNTGIGTNRTAIDAAGVQAGAFALGASGNDAALLVTLAPGNYTAIVSSTTATPGVALAEVYDLSGATAGQKLLNIATRAAAGAGDNTLIAGFVVPPGPAKRVLVRGIGPGLSAFNLTGVLAQPVLTLLNGSTTVATNTNWSTSADAATLPSVSAQVGAFPLATNDSAIVVTLQPGNYTATVVGVGGATGVALIEVYEVP